MLCSTHAVQRKLLCCGLKLFGINSLNLRKTVSVASLSDMLGAFFGWVFFIVLHFFPRRSNFDDNRKHERPRAL